MRSTSTPDDAPTAVGLAGGGGVRSPSRHRAARPHGATDGSRATGGSRGTDGSRATHGSPHPLPGVACEAVGDYDTGGDGAAAEGQLEDAPSASSDDTTEATQLLQAAVARIRGRSPDEMTEAQLANELSMIEAASRQLSARQSRLVAALATRRTRRAKEAARATGRADHTAGRRAKRELRRELTDDLGWAPADAKRALDLGERLDGSDAAGRAYDGGQLSSRHAAVLADTLRHIGDPAVHDDAEAELLDLAARQDPVEFGRSCRRLLARVDAQAAERADERRRRRRSGRLWHTADGMTGASATLSGVDAEVVATAFHAFRRPDAPGEHRTTEQAGADAFVAMARAALDAGSAPADRRVPPHVEVLLDWEQIVTRAGRCEGHWTGPLPTGEIRRLLAECGVSRLLVDPAGVPLEAGERVRHVPVGVYRAIRARDGGCIAVGCDMPAEWSQVMHLGTPYRLEGRLTIDTAALGCPEHHYAFDRLGWTITWFGRRPVLHHPRHQPSPPDGETPGANDRPEAGRETSGSGAQRGGSETSGGRDRRRTGGGALAPRDGAGPATDSDADEPGLGRGNDPPDEAGPAADGTIADGAGQLPLLEPP